MAQKLSMGNYAAIELFNRTRKVLCYFHQLRSWHSMHRREKACYYLLAIVSVLAIFGWMGTYRSAINSSVPQILSSFHVRNVRQDNAEASQYENDDLLFHPFDNECKFAMPNAYASDIVSFHVGERLRQLKCKYDDYDFATMDSEGYMYVHPHFTQFPTVTKDVKCKVIFLEGGIRSKTSNAKKYVEVATVEAPENKRFLANGDAFFIRCHQKEKGTNNTKQVFQKVFAGMTDFMKEKHKVYIVDDTESFDKFGRKRKGPEKLEQPRRYSVDILAFDSTSRTMTMRHMPRTVEMMHKLGYEILYGYTKVGDNSMVNLEPILAGDIPEALAEKKHDNSSDINKNWILPTTKKLDPTLLPFLWKIMKEKYGCRTMFNDDIAVSYRGIFHYPRREFQFGFTTPIADHYYRPYYLAVYQNWTYKACKDGGQIQQEFINLWRRFAIRYKSICHFGFTFITSLTHEAGFLIETVDDFVKSSLEDLSMNDALDNSVSVIMGDHGNRIGLVQYSYTGRIEERMPLMAIRLPSNFKTLYPKEYENFLANKWKLTSNFDIHQTLKDIALMRLGANRPAVRDEGRGISLFDEIPSNRTCYDAYVAENFCTCLIHRPNLTMPKEKNAQKKKAKLIKKYNDAITYWIEENGLGSCLDSSNISISKDVKVLGLNPLVRHGLRPKENITVVEAMQKKPPKMDFLYHEFIATQKLLTGENIELLYRIEEETRPRAALHHCAITGVADITSSLNFILNGVLRKADLFTEFYWTNRSFLANFSFVASYYTLYLRCLGISLISLQRFMSVCHYQTKIEKLISRAPFAAFLALHWFPPVVMIAPLLTTFNATFEYTNGTDETLALYVPQANLAVANLTSVIFVVVLFLISGFCYISVLICVVRSRTSHSSRQQEIRICIQLAGLMVAFVLVFIYSVVQYALNKAHQKSLVYAWRQAHPVMNSFLSSIQPWMCLLFNRDIQVRLKRIVTCGKAKHLPAISASAVSTSRRQQISSFSKSGASSSSGWMHSFKYGIQH
ncbi:unnamed protein product [Cylicocyclus nassatus]|uniref:G-protein coupled receptors family 1 profile domain-containing protein n=1 Tax=Cylicocyclus nassatus TaxID=53992 RepID=A0AA36MAD7_CYLNA|nr:unnamed protein product [Cylicocyclus nassatus]